MRLVSCSLILALAATACVAPNADGGADESSTSADLSAAPNASAFVLTVASDENGIIVTKPDGTSDKCTDFAQCTFAEIANITVSVKPRTTTNTIDCLKFDHWVGACAGQGSTCSLVINQDQTTDAVWSRLVGCRPK